MSEWERFEALRQRLYGHIAACLEEDGHCKSYEGAWSVSQNFPSYFDREEPKRWQLHLDCYVIGPTRHYDWFGETFEEAIAKAEKDIDEWIAEEES